VARRTSRGDRAAARSIRALSNSAAGEEACDPERNNLACHSRLPGDLHKRRPSRRSNL